MVPVRSHSSNRTMVTSSVIGKKESKDRESKMNTPLGGK
ncbi:hypothetical protein CCACVL1_04789 [Corchorus capsularis]|uniref:Uncharacterized protein n=1 Tax=Corchorus capsularis TaxID=210143 RepID=A0A1R3JPN2_COCAP|nr:hypothetical protein CCACVL1_04789 [Corchorus capsularis]